jgi:hypothetical protein
MSLASLTTSVNISWLAAIPSLMSRLRCMSRAVSCKAFHLNRQGFGVHTDISLDMVRCLACDADETIVCDSGRPRFADVIKHSKGLFHSDLKCLWRHLYQISAGSE